MFIFHGESVSEVLILSTKVLLMIRIRKLSMEASIQSIYIIVTNIYDIPWDCVRLMVPALSQLCLTYKDINSVWAGGLEVRGCCGGVSVDVSSSVSRLGSLLLRPRGDHAAATSPALCLHSAAPHTSGPGLLPRHGTRAAEQENMWGHRVLYLQQISFTSLGLHISRIFNYSL